MHPRQINTATRGRGAKRNELLSGYFAAVSGVDRSVGKILAKFDELGIRDNTLVIFTSDNGMNMGHNGIWGKGTFPQNMYEESVKVPFLLSRPSHVPEGLICDHLFSHYDFMPTLMDYMGYKTPQIGELPGRSFASLMRGEEMDGNEWIVVYDEYGPVRMIRTREWKYINRYPYGPHELYHLTQDPFEQQNLINDSTRAKLIAEMRANLHDWFIKYTQSDCDGTLQGVYGKGQIERVGNAGKGQLAFENDWWYVD